ncbi:MAG: hypothetical protein WCL04_03230 [Verrucomicrobiota bacterium]
MPVRPRLPATKTPWPLKWVALAIALFIAIYTPLTLYFRKPGPGYEAAADMEKRSAAAAHWVRIDVTTEHPTDPAGARTRLGPDATITETPIRLPDGLRDVLPRSPSLPAEITAAGAAAESAAGSAYQISFISALASANEQLTGALFFRNGDRLVIVPQTEPIAGNLRARTADAAMLLTVPAGALKPGRYTVTIAANARAKQWTLEVK